MAAGNGIHLFSSRGFTVAGNRVRGHRDGIYLEFSGHATIEGNDSRGNLRYGLHFMYSDSCEYRRNVFAGNGAGVAVMYSRGVAMIGNRFEDNWGPAAYGLLLKEIKDSRIDGNVMLRNTVGLFAEGVDRTEIEGNQFLRNGWAVRLMADATDNAFRRNRFEGNTFDVATNSRASSPSTFSENYWDGYAGYDLNHDGYRGRSLPSGAALLGAGGSERAAAHPAAQHAARPARCRRAGRSGAHARDAGGSPAPDAWRPS